MKKYIYISSPKTASSCKRKLINSSNMSVKQTFLKFHFAAQSRGKSRKRDINREQLTVYIRRNARAKQAKSFMEGAISRGWWWIKVVENSRGRRSRLKDVDVETLRLYWKKKKKKKGKKEKEKERKKEEGKAVYAAKSRKLLRNTVRDGTSIHKTTKEYCNEEDATPLCSEIEFQSLFRRDTSLTILVPMSRGLKEWVDGRNLVESCEW